MIITPKLSKLILERVVVYIESCATLNAHIWTKISNEISVSLTSNIKQNILILS